MSDDLRTKLTNEIMLGQWTDLRPHWAERSAIILVNQELDLVEVAEKIVCDDTQGVDQWLNAGQLVRPNQHQAEAWDRMTDKSFRFIIVQPYVLIQEQGH